MRKLTLSPALSQILGGRKPIDWARLKASECIKDSNQDDAERIDLKPILKLRRIKRPIKIDESLKSIAKLIPENDGFKILVNKSLVGKFSKAHWRFTIAHEIGHTFFFNFNEKPFRRISSHNFIDNMEERLCDIFAAELLMREELVKKNFYELANDNILVSLDLISKKFDVSFDAISIRIINVLSLWNGILLVCKWMPKEGMFSINKEDSAWRIYWSVCPSLIQKKVFIPKPTSYRKFYPSLKWKEFDLIASNLEPGKPKEFSISFKDMGRIGNIRKILKEKYGEKTEYQVQVMAIPSTLSSKNQCNRRQSIAIAIPLD